MKKPLVVSTILLISILVRAQSTAIHQVETTVKTQEDQRRMLQLETGTTAPELYPDENEDVGRQHILRLKPRHEWFQAIVDSQYFYTSNAQLAENGDSSTLWINTIEAAVTPNTYSLLKSDIATRAGVRFQWYNYGLDGSDSPLSVFDFHAQTAYVEESFSPGENWRSWVGLEATRLLSQHDYERIYEELAPNWGIARDFPIAKDKMFAISYRGYYRITDTQPLITLPIPGISSDINDRTDHTITFSYLQRLYPKLTLQPYYRFQFTHYTTGTTRNEYLNTVGVFLNYDLCRNATVRTFASYERRDTDDSTLPLDYNKFDTGLGITINVRF